MTVFLIRFVLKWVAARLQEKSTYAGLFVLLAGHLGLYFSPEMQGALTQTLIDGAGAALVALSGQDAVHHYAVAAGANPSPPILSPNDPRDNTADLNRDEVKRVKG